MLPKPYKPCRAFLVVMLSTTLSASAQNLLWHNEWQYLWQGTVVQYFGDGAMAVDADANTYMVSQLIGTMDVDPGPGTTTLTSGVVNGNQNPSSICLSKFDPNGTWLWTKQIGHNMSNAPQAVAVDPTGNVYLSGWFSGTVDFDPGPGVANLISAGHEDIFVMKCDPDGNYLWAHGFGSAHETEGGWELAVDGSGNAFVMISAFNTFDVDPGTGLVPFTPAGQLSSILKLDSDGNYVWAKTLQFSSTHATFHHIAADANGNLAIAGEYSGALDLDPGPDAAYLPWDSTLNYHSFIMKWDPEGNYVWGKAFENVFPRNITCDDLGNVITVGGLNGEADLDPGPGVHMHNDGNAYQTGWVLKLDPDGIYQWSKAWTTNQIVQVDNVVADHNGNVILSGIYSRDMDLAPGPVVVPAPHVSSGRCGFITALDAGGSYLWSGELGNGEFNAYLDFMALAPDNGLRICGWFHGEMDLDPGPGTTLYTGPTAFQSTMLLAIDNVGISTALPRANPFRTSIYPSPTNGPLSITCDERIERVDVRNTNGQLMFSESLRTRAVRLDLSALAAGCYVVEVIGANSTERRTVMKY